MDRVVKIFGTDNCGCPRKTAKTARLSLCQSLGIAFDQGIGEGDPNERRSYEFSKLWKNMLSDADDPEKELVHWMRNGAPVGR